MISENEGCDEEVRHRKGIGWGKEQGIVCDMRMPIMLKVALNKTVIMHIQMNESEIWALINAEPDLSERTHLRMLRWMMGINRIERIIKEEIRASTGVTNISDKIREARLRWLGHVERKREEVVVMRKWKMEVSGDRKTGRPKLGWSDDIQKYMKENGVGT